MKTLFNDGWQFAKLHFESADFPLPSEAELLSLPDDKFQPVRIPHDWLIWNTNDLYENSIGVYRKTFIAHVPESSSGCGNHSSSDIDFCKNIRTIIRFEGVYMDTSVFVNGTKTTEWKYGYTTFETDITSFLKDGENTITVVSVYRSPNTRWYSGAGIFRNIWKLEVPEAHLVSDGVYFTASRKDDGSWTAKIKAEACYLPIVSRARHKEVELPDSAASVQPAFKCKQAVVRFSLADEAGSVVAETTQQVTLNPVVTDNPYWYLDPAGSSAVEAEFTLSGISEWDVSAPHLYTLTVELYESGESTSASRLPDSCIQKVGFRDIRFNKNEGFFLNGKHMKINGACIHHDLGALGSAFNLTALKRQFQKMHDMGVNAIRLSHNPPAPELMELADEMGMLIDSECFDIWEKSKTEYDYARFFPEWHERDVASWIRRDRNHPSLIMWSIGNEIYDTHQGNGFEITKDLTALVRKHDPAKNAPVTIASNYMEWQGAQSCAEQIDLAGYNYGERLYEGHHKAHPAWRIYGSETSATVQSRGTYHFPASFRALTHDDSQCSSLGNCSTNWGAANAADTIIRDRDAPFSAGQFIWTGWDYIGEPTPYFTKNSFFGQVDTAGFEKDTYYQYQAEWTDYHTKPMVHLLPYWDFNIGQLIDIRAYTNAPQIELLFNGKSCGTQRIDHAHGMKLAGEWQLPYAPGTITAVARDENGAELARESRTTPGDPARITVKLDKQRFEGPHDLIFAEIHTVDASGNPVDNARNRISVAVTGAHLEGLDNGDSTDYEQYKCTSRRLFNNALTAILSPDPENWDAPFSLEVSSPGLEGAAAGLLSESTAPDKASSADKAPDADKAAGADSLSEGSAPKQASFADKACDASALEVPVRKIELTVSGGSLSAGTASNKTSAADKASGARALGPDNREVTVNARILPENATYRALKFEAVRLEGIASRAVSLTPLAGAPKADDAVVKPASFGKAADAVVKPASFGKADDAAVKPASFGKTADASVKPASLEKAADASDSAVRVTALQDGEFRLRCSCGNGTGIPEIISELEFSVSGMGSSCLNPYEFISACEKSASLAECKLSFLGGVYVPEGRNWISFENVDFGPEGSDTFTIPIFSFDTTMPFELWDGNPDNGGRLLMAFEYNSPSWYNHYQSNTWTLPRRLTGIHDLYFLSSTSRFSIQGIQFEKSRKAFSRLSALDADSITGDAFTRESDRISGIGNNVSLEFCDMDFGTEPPRRITITGRAVNGTNTVHILFEPDGTVIPNSIRDLGDTRTAVEIPATLEVTEHSFDISVPISGKCRVAFVFLPGSCFDFVNFQFS